MGDLWDSLARGQRSADDRDGRIYGVQFGKVTSNSDGRGLMRVKARMEVMDDGQETDWLIPAFMGGMESIPEVNDLVMVWFKDGDPNRGVYACFPSSKTQGRPTEAMVLGATMVGLYNDLVAKLNLLQSHYQAFYTFVQGHVHASFGTVSASLVEAIIGPTSHNTSTDAAKGKASDGSTPAAISDSRIVLSKRGKVR